ncbi:mitochondrial enolase superfamily member 1 [Grus japonensis]|uniref:E3 ubiquitin-protein ligase Topors n=1 Tax=Grus japonensis TaxID=30415 RepID=A0ABC9Y5Q4_GRUJA
MEAMATELEDRCPICLGSWEEPSFVMPCLHRFCYPCILRWAETKPECPLCKRGIRSILHSVRADDDYVEHVVTPPVTPPVIIRQGGGAPRHPAAHHLHHPGAPQRWAAEGLPRRPVGGLYTPNWMSGLRNNSTLIQILQPLVQREQEEMFAAFMGTPNNRGLERELPGRMLGVSHQNPTATLARQRAHQCIPKSKKSSKGGRRPAWMSKELLEKLKGKKEVYRMWKKGLATWEEYRDVVRECRDATRKAKAHLELNLARDVKDNKKGFFKSISSKRKTRENVGPLLNEVGALVTEDTEKTELLSAAFASIFTAKAGPQESQTLEVREKVWRKEDLPSVEEDRVREHLGKLNIHKSMGPDGMHP